jgi:hypothetical protein
MGHVAGGGVVIDNRHVLTCAHVVAAALGVSANGPRPDGQVVIEFPGLPDHVGRTSADVRVDGWTPLAADERGDLAVLTAAIPEQIRPALLRQCGPPSQRPVRVAGYPRGLRLGVWARGRLVGAGGPAAEWIQLDTVDDAGGHVDKGFSGAGVVDEQTGAVIGLIVAVMARTGPVATRVAWMVPVEVVARYWPALDRLIATDDRRQQPAANRIPAVPGRAAVSTADLMHLGGLFAALPTFAIDRSRDHVLNALPGPIPGMTTRHSMRLMDTVSIIQTCLNYPGGLASLVAVVRQLEGDSFQVRAIEEAVAALPGEATQP